MWEDLRLIVGIAVLAVTLCLAVYQRGHPRPHDKAAALRQLRGWLIRDRHRPRKGGMD